MGDGQSFAMAALFSNEKTMLTARALNRNGIFRPWGNPDSTLTFRNFSRSVQVGRAFRLRLERADTGFVMAYADLDGNNTTTIEMPGIADIVQVCEKNRMYVGFFAAGFQLDRRLRAGRERRSHLGGFYEIDRGEQFEQGREGRDLSGGAAGEVGSHLATACRSIHLLQASEDFDSPTYRRELDLRSQGKEAETLNGGEKQEGSEQKPETEDKKRGTKGQEEA